MKRCCATCEFWNEKDGPQKGLGRCQRHAPNGFQKRDGNLMTRWPITQASDFCGDHEVKEELKGRGA